MKKNIIILLLLSSCQMAGKVQMTPIQSAYYNKAEQMPLTFKLPKSDAHVAWGRAQAFVALHSTMSIQTATDFILQTKSVIIPDNVGYSLTQTPLVDSSQFTVECNALFTNWERDQNEVADIDAHVLAYYMKTAEAPPDSLVYP